jgi:hypothetical protein
MDGFDRISRVPLIGSGSSLPLCGDSQFAGRRVWGFGLSVREIVLRLYAVPGL